MNDFDSYKSKQDINSGLPCNFHNHLSIFKHKCSEYNQVSENDNEKSCQDQISVKKIIYNPNPDIYDDNDKSSSSNSNYKSKLFHHEEEINVYQEPSCYNTFSNNLSATKNNSKTYQNKISDFGKKKLNQKNLQDIMIIKDKINKQVSIKFSNEKIYASKFNRLHSSKLIKKFSKIDNIKTEEKLGLFENF
jgi:hypothetical protein